MNAHELQMCFAKNLCMFLQHLRLFHVLCLFVGLCVKWPLTHQLSAAHCQSSQRKDKWLQMKYDYSKPLLQQTTVYTHISHELCLLFLQETSSQTTTSSRHSVMDRWCQKKGGRSSTLHWPMSCNLHIISILGINELHSTKCLHCVLCYRKYWETNWPWWCMM